MRLTGMGIKDPTVILPAARVAASLTFLRRAEALRFPVQCVRAPEDWDVVLNELQAVLGAQAEPMAAWVRDFRPTDACDEHLSQKWWTHRIHRRRHELLVQNASLRDGARLRLQKMPHTTAWMAVIPNVGLGLKLEGREYRYLAKWWLGRASYPGKMSVARCARRPWTHTGTIW